MEAGRELDALIAQKVFGYTLDYEFADMMFDGAPCVKELRDGNDEWGILPSYSTDIGDAWRVMEHITALICVPGPRGGVRVVRWVSQASIYTKTHERFGDYAIHIEQRYPKLKYIASALSKTAPHAICLAALKAIDDHNQH